MELNVDELLKDQPENSLEDNKLNFFSRNKILLITITTFLIVLTIGVNIYVRSTIQDVYKKVSEPLDKQNVATSGNTTTYLLLNAINQYTVLNNDYDTSVVDENKVFLSEINGIKKSEINIGYFVSTQTTDPYQTKGYLYSPTADGKYLL